MTNWKDLLSAEAREACAKWPNPCRAVFDVLGESFPTELLTLCNHEILDNVDMTFALERLGSCELELGTDLRDSAIAVLKKYASEKHGLVTQEGALYGLVHTGCECKQFLLDLSQDTSQHLMIREIAADLSWYE